jgi:RNA polymerase sigma-70 factor (ECF subfamily)
LNTQIAPTVTDDISPLITDCARGQRAALKALYEREARTMIGVAARIVRRRELAEEVVHDVFVQVWRHAGSFDPALGSGRVRQAGGGERPAALS